MEDLVEAMKKPLRSRRKSVASSLSRSKLDLAVDIEPLVLEADGVSLEDAPMSPSGTRTPYAEQHPEQSKPSSGILNTQPLTTATPSMPGTATPSQASCIGVHQCATTVKADKRACNARTCGTSTIRFLIACIFLAFLYGFFKDLLAQLEKQSQGTFFITILLEVVLIQLIAFIYEAENCRREYEENRCGEATGAMILDICGRFAHCMDPKLHPLEISVTAARLATDILIVYSEGILGLLGRSSPQTLVRSFV